MATEAFRCAEASQARDEPLYGTASFVKRWLLLEQPGSWGRDALSQSRLPQGVAQELRRRAQRAGVRIILIRRGVQPSSDKRQCYFVRTEECDLYQAHMQLDSVDDLLDVDLLPLRQGRPIPEAEERKAPLFLICTHGRHDQCCSIRGNQVSRVACAQPDADAWECSHIGGDRFAANLVCFPHGLYYGRVGSQDVLALMDAYRRGSLSLEHYRGRCCYVFAVQAAEYLARRETSCTGIDAVALNGFSLANGGVKASFTIEDRGIAEVHVRAVGSRPRRLTCTATGESAIPRYELVSCALR